MVNQATFVALEKETYLEFLLGSLPTGGIVLETDNYTIHYLFMGVFFIKYVFLIILGSTFFSNRYRDKKVGKY